MRDAKFTYELLGATREFSCFPTWFSQWMCQTILHGETYPPIPFVRPVDVVLDVGANCGAATVLFAATYPDAHVHAFEPGTEQVRLLKDNTRAFPNVQVHAFGLHDSDQQVPLYHGAFDSATASIIQSDDTSAESEPVLLRSAAGWLGERSIDRVDILKLDTEGCELPILTDVGDALVSEIKVIYVEYHSEDDRKELDARLGESHIMVCGRNYYRTGELTYVKRGTFDPDGQEIADWTKQRFSREFAASTAVRMPGPG